MAAVARGDIDVAAVWGPAAGWLASQQPSDLALVPIADPAGGARYRFTFDIAMGVRRDDADLREKVDAVIATHRAEIRHILASYHVPLAPFPAAGDVR